MFLSVLVLLTEPKTGSSGIQIVFVFVYSTNMNDVLETVGTKGVWFTSLSQNLAQCLPHGRYSVNICGIIGC